MMMVMVVLCFSQIGTLRGAVMQCNTPQLTRQKMKCGIYILQNPNVPNPCMTEIRFEKTAVISDQ